VDSGWKGIAESVLAEAGIVVQRDSSALIPYLDSDWSSLRTRFRSATRTWWGPGDAVYPFGLEQLPLPGDRFSSFCALVLAEGESDALAVREHFASHEDAVAVHYYALGVPGANCFRPEWRVVCEPYDLLYAVGDGDPAGRRFVHDVRRIVPWARPVVCPDGLDLRALLQSEGLQSVLPLLRASDAFVEKEYAVLHGNDLDHARALVAGEP
jgi:hypothetical protein